jgi:hypothetical protein
MHVAHCAKLRESIKADRVLAFSPYSIIGARDVSLTDVANTQKKFGHPRVGRDKFLWLTAGLSEALDYRFACSAHRPLLEKLVGALHAQIADFLLHHCQE